MSEAEITAGPFGAWIEGSQGIVRVDAAVTQLQVLRHGEYRIVLLVRDGEEAERLVLPPDVARRVAWLLLPDVGAEAPAP